MKVGGTGESGSRGKDGDRDQAGGELARAEQAQRQHGPVRCTHCSRPGGAGKPRVPSWSNGRREKALERGETLGLSVAEWTIAVLYNGLGRHDEALASAKRAGDHHDVGSSDWSLGELIPAAVRCGKPERAVGALQQLAARADDCKSEWALGIEARSRALLSEGEDADSRYR